MSSLMLRNRWDIFLKRLLDVVVASCAFMLALPLMMVVAIAVRVLIGSPILHRQVRPGLGRKPFTLYKFRSMSDRRDHAGQLLPDAQRLTQFGRFLRSTSLDELPELVNVLRGEMSLVGPRPLLMEYLPLYNERQRRRHDVRPGITGWAQVNGRNAISWQQKFELDVWYVENRTLLLDLRILMLTVTRVLGRSGISQEGHVTAERFRGDES